MKSTIERVAIPVVTSVLTVLLIIPGEQGETILRQALNMLIAFVAGN